MATLSSALNYAISGLTISSAESALLSRNVSFAGDENYTRKTAEIYTLPGGSPAISNINRSADKRLLDKLLTATSVAAGKNALLEAVTRLGTSVGDPQDDGSLAALMGKLEISLKTYETNPSNLSLASAAVSQAKVLAERLNTISLELADLRSETDRSMSDSVGGVNSLLAQFKVVNDTITRGVGTADDLAESLDQRDAILKKLSEEIGIRSVTRPNNDVVIYAEGGAVLFEGSPRVVSMQPTRPFGPSSVGQAVYIDGVPVTGPYSLMPVSSGRLSALATVRDQTAITFQNQLDEIASGLIRNFSEQDQSSMPSLPDSPGLFIDLTGGLPAAGSVSPGLASRIRINASADPAQDGSPFLLRDGGFGGASYVYNQPGAASYQSRISELIGTFDRTITFDASAGLGLTASLTNFSVGSASWVEANRKEAQDSSSAQEAARLRASEALLRVTGVNIDLEMASLLDLEKSYQASSKIISVVDSMLASLLQAVG